MPKTDTDAHVEQALLDAAKHDLGLNGAEQFVVVQGMQPRPDPAPESPKRSAAKSAPGCKVLRPGDLPEEYVPGGFVISGFVRVAPDEFFGSYLNMVYDGQRWIAAPPPPKPSEPTPEEKEAVAFYDAMGRLAAGDSDG